MTDTDAHDKNGPIGGRRSLRLSQAGKALGRRVLQGAAAGRGFAEPEVLLRWREIVGAGLADICRPVRVRYRQGAGIGATLVVQVPGARAPEIEHLAPRLIERVNQYYGYRAVGRLSITQATAAGRSAGFAEEAGTFRGVPPTGPQPPTPEHRARARESSARIRDPRLRAALADLGAWVLADPSNPESPAD